MKYIGKIISVVLTVSLSAPVLADPPEGKGWKKHRGGGDESVSVAGSVPAGSVLVSAGITVGMARQIAIDSGVSFGVYQDLPPGIRRNLARGKPLPPGIAKNMAPQAMLGRLPQHPGYEWQVAGTDLVLVQIGTAVVADVLAGVFR